MTLSQAVAIWVKDLLSHYPKSQWPEGGKIIHDSCWGTAEFLPHEVVVMDSPIVQRLRFIHQTGLAFMAFPSARHSRFEHSLGSTIIADRMMTSFELRTARPDVEPEEKLRFTNPQRQTIRLAALLHDTGFGPFSHASEAIWYQFGCFRDALKERRYKGHKPAEIISYLIASSKPFQDFLESVKAKTRADFEPKSIPNFILGMSANPRHEQHLAMIVNGPFDADKIDYIRRDSSSTGVGVWFDLERLLRSIRKGDPPSESRPGMTKSSLVIERRGIPAVEQLARARYDLQMTVYYHQKVRVAECMLRRLLLHVRDTKNSPWGIITLTEDPTDLLRLTDGDIFAGSVPFKSHGETHKLAHGLVFRRLPKRLAVLTNHTTIPMGRRQPEMESPAQSNFFSKALLQPGYLQQAKVYESAIVAGLPSTCKEPLVLVDFVPAPEMRSILSETRVITDKSKYEHLATLKYSKQYQETFLRGQPHVYIFCDPELRRLARVRKSVVEATRKLHCLTVDNRAFTEVKVEPPDPDPIVANVRGDQ